MYKAQIIVTDYIQVNTDKDVADEIQKVIDNNPRRTIYFPDGEYIISKPICIPAHFSTAVSIEMANFAIIRASDDWSSDEAMIRLGGKDRHFGIKDCGTNNFFKGGVIDGNLKAKGMSIDSGREFFVNNVSMKNVTMGIHVKLNSEYGSNDCDISNVNMVGAGTKGSVGLLIDGADNTFTNLRIANFEVGVRCTNGGNFMRYLHPLFIYKGAKTFNQAGEVEYEDGIGFDDQSIGNWYENCYADNFAIGFRMESKTVSVYNCCYAYWYSAQGGFETFFESTGKFNSVLKSPKVHFGEETENAFLKVAELGGDGIIENPIFLESSSSDKTFRDYIDGKIANAWG